MATAQVASRTSLTHVDHDDQLVQLRRFGFVNAWLVVEDDGVSTTLVDTTALGAGSDIVDIARASGLTIERIVVTHEHGDHTGSLDELHELLPDALVFCSAATAALMSGDEDHISHVGAGGRHVDDRRFVRPRATHRTTRPDILLEPGDQVGSLRVHDAAGHQCGQLALHHERSNTLLCADAFTTLGGVRTTSYVNPRFPVSGMATEDRAAALDSAERLTRLAPARLAPGHGPLVTSRTSERMQLAVELAHEIAG